MEEKDGEEAQTHTHRTEQTDKQTHMRRWTEQDRLTKMAFGNGNLGSQNFA